MEDGSFTQHHIHGFFHFPCSMGSLFFKGALACQISASIQSSMGLPAAPRRDGGLALL